MVDVTRPKMHIWGENRVQKVIFTDEASMYFAKGWRNHPSKVGKPLEVEAVKEPEPVIDKIDKMVSENHIVDKVDIVGKENVYSQEVRIKRAYNKRG